MPFPVMSLVREVYRQCGLAGIQGPYVTRLVKLLYLADIEWRKRGNGPLAEVTWRFLHYGPYAYELQGSLGDEGMEAFQDGERVARRFAFDAEELEATSKELPEALKSIFSQLVREWGDANIFTLLDYVYFETEPMENAQRGEVLDFSKLTANAVTRSLKLDPSAIEKLRSKIRERAVALNLSREGMLVPVVDLDSEAAWIDDEVREIKLADGTRITW